MRQRPTNDNDSHMRVVTFPGGFVFEKNLFVPVGFSFTGTILVWAVTLILLRWNIFIVAAAGFLPPAITIGIVQLLFNKKPPHYLYHLMNLMLLGNERGPDLETKKHPIKSL